MKPESANTSNDLTEQTVLGALLSSPEYYNSLSQVVSAELFTNPANAAIFAAIAEMNDRGQDADAYTVSKQLRGNADVVKAGGAAYITGLLRYASLQLATQYGLMLREEYIRRQISTELTKIQASLIEDDLEDTLGMLNRLADRATEATEIGSGSRHIREVLNDAMQDAERKQAAAANGETVGITTGLVDLDRITTGWKGSQLIVVAGRPSMGKTAVMLHFAKAAATSGVPVCIYSLEMSGISLINRLLISESGINADRFRHARMTADDWARLEEANGTLSRLPIYVDDKASVGMRYIRSHTIIRHRKGQCGIVFIDYLGLAETVKVKGKSREQEVAEVSRQAKLLAKELNIPVVLLSQLNREVESRRGCVPSMADLRDSGAIEQDADIVALLYRPAYYGIKTKSHSRFGEIITEGILEIDVAKQRDGATMTAVVQHNESMTRITDYQPAGLTPLPPHSGTVRKRYEPEEDFSPF